MVHVCCFIQFITKLPSGATQNAELVAAAQEALDKILTLFPGLDTDSALGPGKGGQQVACTKIRGKILMMLSWYHPFFDLIFVT